MLRRARFCLMGLLSLALLAGRATAADDVLHLVPPGALGYGVVHHLDQTDAKLGRLAQATELPLPGVLGLLRQLTGAMQGVDPTGSAAVVVLPGPEASALPASVLIVPVSDYPALVGALQPEKLDDRLTKVRTPQGPFLAAQRGGYALLAGSKDRAALETLLAADGGAAKDIQRQDDGLAGSDVALVVTRAGIELATQKGSEALAEVRKGMEETVKQLEKAEDLPEGMNKEQMQEQVKLAADSLAMYDAALTGIRREVASVGLGLTVDEKNVVRLAMPIRFMPESAAGQMAGRLVAAEGQQLAGLPNEPFFLALGAALSEDLFAAMSRGSVQLLQVAPELYGLAPEQVQKLAEVSAQYMQGAEGMGMVLGLPGKDEPIYGRMAGVVPVDDSAAFLARYDEYVEKMRQIVGEEEGSMFSGMTMEKVEIEGKSGVALSMNYPQMPGLEKQPGFDKMMEAMYGPGGKITAYLVAADPKTIVLGYVSREAVARGLKALTNEQAGLTAAAPVEQVLPLLPAKAPVVALWSLGGTRDFMQRTIDVTLTAMAGQAPEVSLPEFPDAPPVGLAAQGAEGTLTLHAAIRPETLQAAAGYIMNFTRNFGLVAP